MSMAPRSSVAVAALATLITGAAPALAAPNHQFFVYWDQNEEEDMLIDGQVKQLVQPWDPNGQMCIFPDHSGRFVVGYNPDPPVPGRSRRSLSGWCGDRRLSQAASQSAGGGGGVGSARQLHSRRDDLRPGAVRAAGSTIGGDVPPEGGAPWQTGAYNNDSSFTGCAFDRAGHLFAVDIATAQGQIPVPDSGRLIEWFPPDYTSYCIIYGPDTGGVGPHHVDGTGGLSDPGMLAVYHDDVYLPETGPGR